MLLVTDLESREAEVIEPSPSSDGRSSPSEALIARSLKYFEKMYRDHRQRLKKTSLTAFHTALARGDEDFVHQVLQRTGKDVRRFALNLLVDHDDPAISHLRSFQGEAVGPKGAASMDMNKAWEEDQLKCQHNEDSLCFELPLALAVLSGKFQLVRLLVDSGANVLLTDSKGNNLAHCLVALSDSHLQLAASAYTSLLEMMGNDAESCKLLMCLNKEGFNPLEMAADMALPEMLQLILRTNGVYRFPIHRRGIYDHVLYDVSRYESKAFWEDYTVKPVLFLLTCVSEPQMARLTDSKVFSQEPLHTWYNTKMTNNKIGVHLWALVWLIYIFFYGCTIISYVASAEVTPAFVNAGLLVISVFFMSAETVQILLQIRNFGVVWRKRRRGQGPCLAGLSEHFIHLSFASSMTVTYLLHIVGPSCEKHSEMYAGLHYLNGGLVSLIIIFFTKFTSKAGHYAVLMEKASLDAVVFIGVSSIVFASIVIDFYTAHHAPKCVLGAAANSTGTEDFSSIWGSIYETMMLAIGISPPSDLYFRQAYYSRLALGIYIVCVLLLNVLLFNLIIAVLTQRVTEITNQKDTIVLLQKLHILLFIENKVRSRWVFTMLRKTGLARWLCGSKGLVQGKNASRVYLHVVEKVIGAPTCATENFPGNHAEKLPKIIPTV